MRWFTIHGIDANARYPERVIILSTIYDIFYLVFRNIDRYFLVHITDAIELCIFLALCKEPHDTIYIPC